MKRKALFAAACAALLSVASANALAQEDAPPPAPVVAAAPAPPAGTAAPAIVTAPTVTAAPAVAPAPPDADLLLAHGPLAPASAVAPAPPALAAQEIQAPPAPPESPDTPEPRIGFADSFFDDGNYLGVSVEEVTRENAKAYGLSGEPRGVGVTKVLKDSPAERAGLRERDIILRFDGEAVTSVRKLTRLITESSPDHTARITVLRGGSEQELSATLARRERMAPAVAGNVPFLGGIDLAEAQRFGEEWAKNAEEWKRQNKSLGEWGGDGAFVVGPSRRIGVATSTLGKQLADYFGVSHGILVNSVETGSPADKAGLRAGDVVTEVEGKQVDDASDLLRALGAKEEGDITLTVVRDKKQRTVRVTPERWKAPRGLFVNPGGVSVTPPVASAALPRFSVIPRASAAPGIIGAPYTLKDPDFITPPIVIEPHALATPRVFAAPRVTVTPRVAPRVTVIKPGGRIL